MAAQIKPLEEKVTIIDTQLRTAENEISILGGKGPKLVGLSASDSCRASIIRCMGELDLYVLTNASVQYSNVVAYNSSGDELMVEDVAYKKLLIPYKGQSKECFFTDSWTRMENGMEIV